jgi:ubiquinone/menaquinone biosynthesis C-methylase UbiE
LKEIRRVLKPGGKLALGFTRYSGQSNSGLSGTLDAAGFAGPQVANADTGFCLLAAKPL